MKVVTHRDEHGKRIRLRSYRCEPRDENYWDRRWRLPLSKYAPHQGKREKARRLARIMPMSMAAE
jgi:hypothetical protein